MAVFPVVPVKASVRLLERLGKQEQTIFCPLCSVHCPSVFDVMIILSFVAFAEPSGEIMSETDLKNKSRGMELVV